MTRITIDVTGSGQVALEFNGECAVWIEADGQRIRVDGERAEALTDCAIAFLEMVKAQAQLVLAKGSA